MLDGAEAVDREAALEIVVDLSSVIRNLETIPEFQSRLKDFKVVSARARSVSSTKAPATAPRAPRT